MADDDTEPLPRERARRRRQQARRRRRAALAFGVLAVLAVVVLVVVTRGDDPTDVTATGSSTTTTAVAPSTTGTTGTAVATTPTTLPPSPSATTAVAAPAGDCSTAAWTVEARAASLVFASLESDSEAELDRTVALGVGGVFIGTPAVPLVVNGAIRRLANDAPMPPLVSIDEEGGRVQRLRSILGNLPSARALAALPPAEIKATAQVRALRMRALGITMDFAPVLDLVDDVDDDRGIGDRSFSADPFVATAAAGAFAHGLSESGVLPTYKHFPGHGHASGDSHLVLPTTPPIESLRKDDLLPYRGLLAPGKPTAAVMIGHLDVPGLTGGLPASISPAAVRLLRDEIGFQGLVVTDDLGAMRAILDTYTTTDAAVLAVIAGIDMVLVPSADAAGAAAAIAAAVHDGRLTEDQLTASADRVLRARRGTACA